MTVTATSHEDVLIQMIINNLWKMEDHEFEMFHNDIETTTLLTEFKDKFANVIKRQIEEKIVKCNFDTKQDEEENDKVDNTEFLETSSEATASDNSVQSTDNESPC